jgi:hypothetical protein
MSVLRGKQYYHIVLILRAHYLQAGKSYQHNLLQHVWTVR